MTERRDRFPSAKHRLNQGIRCAHTLGNHNLWRSSGLSYTMYEFGRLWRSENGSSMLAVASLLGEFSSLLGPGVDTQNCMTTSPPATARPSSRECLTASASLRTFKILSPGTRHARSAARPLQQATNAKSAAPCAHRFREAVMMIDLQKPNMTRPLHQKKLFNSGCLGFAS